MQQRVLRVLSLSCVALCCMDLQPFDIMSGEGFKHVAHINIRARYGSVNANMVLPNRQTVCERAKKTAKLQKEKLSKDVNKALENGVAIITDMWTDDYNKRAYTVLTCHYVDDEWTLNARVIATAEFDASLPKTAENLKEHINRELQEFGISKIVFDQGANIKAALRNYHWTPCTCLCSQYSAEAYF
ncbi:UNVERIFIED_CONTAM: hypothetical protein FKN15_026822 [Acipenser sinensis]